LRQIDNCRQVLASTLRFSVNMQKNKDALMVHTLAHCKESKVMRVGVPKEIKTHVCRVGLTPAAVREYVAAGPFASYRGVRLPIVRRISMDSITVDLSALPPDRLAAGSLVDVIDDTQTADHVARYAGTIGHEILTGLGSRFHRNYVGG
jgi:Alanine racemase, C-terminal domain